ncbi:MAG: 50S ribosomal protein L4 [Candidatus Daviesbacteria bacterium]|nr:50S ribosomal protein L4 [Candidatus Daviesbacteria bacterium]
MPVKKVISKKRKVTSDKKQVTRKKAGSASLSVPVYSLAGRVAGTLSLPKEIFGVKVNKTLLSQAARVYLTNKKTLLGSTKTRGEIEGSTAKIYRQKGTGRARHGAIRAPIFVGGGITFGPKSRKVRLDLPKKMKKAALLSALSAKAADKNVIGLAGVEKASGKTKELSKVLNKITGENKGMKSVLIVTEGKADNMIRAVRNIPGVSILSTNLINAYEVLRHDLLILNKEAVNVILGSKTTPESGKKDSGRALLARMTKKGKKK